MVGGVAPMVFVTRNCGALASNGRHNVYTILGAFIQPLASNVQQQTGWLVGGPVEEMLWLIVQLRFDINSHQLTAF